MNQFTVGNVMCGTGTLTLPANVTAGHYDVVALVGPGLTPVATVGITVAGQTPVPETPSVLGLLLPALLVGIYVSRKKKRTN